MISRDPNFDIEVVICVNSLAAALSAATKEVFFIGGGQMYKEALLFTYTIYATEVQAEFPNIDTFFPDLPNGWVETSRVNNTQDAYDYDFVRYIKQ